MGGPRLLSHRSAFAGQRNYFSGVKKSMGPYTVGYCTAILHDQAAIRNIAQHRIKSKFSHFPIFRHPAAFPESTSSLYSFVICTIVIEDMAEIDAEHFIAARNKCYKKYTTKQICLAQSPSKRAAFVT